MRRIKTRHIFAYLLAVSICTGTFLLSSTVLMAAGNPEQISGVEFFIPDETVVYLSSTVNDLFLSYPKASVKAVKNIKSSNKKTATASIDADPENNQIIFKINPKKTGKTVVSFDFKYKKKTYHFKTKVVVKKYENPFKSMKIGTVRMDKYLDSAFLSSAINAHVPLKKTLSKKQLSFKLKKGWKLLEVFMTGTKGDGSLKNGQKVTIKKGSEIDFQIKDPKGNDLWFYFFFD